MSVLEMFCCISNDNFRMFRWLIFSTLHITKYKRIAKCFLIVLVNGILSVCICAFCLVHKILLLLCRLFLLLLVRLCLLALVAVVIDWLLLLCTSPLLDSISLRIFCIFLGLLRLVLFQVLQMPKLCQILSSLGLYCIL